MRGNKGRLLVAASMLLLFGCGSSGPKMTIHHRPSPRPVIKALFLLPSDLFLRRLRAHHIYEKGTDVLEYWRSRTGLAVFGNGEYKVFSGKMITDLPGGTTIPSELERLGMDVNQALALRFSLTEQIQQDAAVVTHTKRRGRHQRGGYSSELRLEIEVYHVGTNRAVLTFVMKRKVDPFMEVPDYDDQPWARALLLDGMKRVHEQLKGLVILSPRPATGKYQLLEPPAVVAAARYEGLPCLNFKLEGKEDMMRQVVLSRRARYRYRGLDKASIRKLSKVDQGLMVTGAPPPCTGLQPGDVVVVAGKARLKHPWQWDRLISSHRGPLTLSVLRGGKSLEINWNCASSR